MLPVSNEKVVSRSISAPTCGRCGASVKIGTQGRYLKYCHKHSYGSMPHEVAEGVKLGLSNREIALRLNTTLVNILHWARSSRKLGLFTSIERRSMRRNRNFTYGHSRVMSSHIFVLGVGGLPRRCWICGMDEE